jgi:pimeloyl-ACP methyl ester carboxylesterase
MYQKPYLAEKYRAVSFDFRGHGRSEVPESRDYHVERLAEDLKAVVDAFEPEQFVVAGHSMGGYAAFKFYEHFGKEYEGRLKGLAIIDSTGLDLATGMSLRWRLFGQLNKNQLENDLSKALAAKLSDSSLMYVCIRWLMFGERPLASELEWIQRMGCSTPIATTKGAGKDLNDYCFEYYLPNVDIPVMLLVGSEDSLMANDRENTRTYALLPDARLKVFEGTGHMSPQERPEEFNGALDGFLTEVFSGE